MARAKGRRQEIYTRLFQMPIKQSLASKETGGAILIGNISRTMKLASTSLDHYQGLME